MDEQQTITHTHAGQKRDVQQNKQTTKLPRPTTTDRSGNGPGLGVRISQQPQRPTVAKNASASRSILSLGRTTWQQGARQRPAEQEDEEEGKEEKINKLKKTVVKPELLT